MVGAVGIGQGVGAGGIGQGARGIGFVYILRRSITLSKTEMQPVNRRQKGDTANYT